MTICPDANTNSSNGGNCYDLYVAAQKSGFVYGLDPASGEVEWASQVGPSSDQGGHEWGSASDNNYVYVANANAGSVLTNLTNPVQPAASGAEEAGDMTPSNGAELGSSAAAINWAVQGASPPVGNDAAAAAAAAANPASQIEAEDQPVGCANGLVGGATTNGGIVAALDPRDGKVRGEGRG